MKKGIILTGLTFVASIAGVVGLQGAAYADTVYVTDPESIQLCQDITPATSTDSAQYTFTRQDSNMNGNITSFSLTGDGACQTINLSNLYFNDSTPKESVVRVTTSGINNYSTLGSEYFDLYFAVEHTVDGNDNITGDIAHLTYIKDSGGNKVSDLLFAYDQGASPSHIVLTKTVAGKGGDTNASFNFTVNVNGTSGTNYRITNVTTGRGSTCAAQTDCSVSLKHGETVTIGQATNGTEQIDAGTTFTITEEDNDYQTYINGSLSSTKSTGQRTISSDVANNTFAYVNKKSSPVGTGVVLNVLPYILLAFVATGAVVFYAKSARK